MFSLCESATDVLTFTAEIGAALFVMCDVSLTNTLMTKSVPFESKGTLLGLYKWCGTVGTFVISKAGGALYDVDKDLPFMVIASTAWVYALVILILALCGFFKK